MQFYIHSPIVSALQYCIELTDIKERERQVRVRKAHILIDELPQSNSLWFCINGEMCLVIHTSNKPLANLQSKHQSGRERLF